MRYLFFIILFVVICQFNAISSYQLIEKDKDLLDDSFVTNVISSESITDILLTTPVKNVNNKNSRNNGTSGLNTFSGNVYIGDNLLPEGSIFILENNKENIVKKSLTEIRDGYFEFKELESGTYILYVIPIFDYDFFYFPKYLPTYSGDTYKWESSVLKNLEFDQFNFSLYLLSYSDPFYGHEKISGRIIYDYDFGGNRDIPVPVILLNQSKEPMDFRIANSSTGNFAFNHLPTGTYYLHPEIPGIKTEDFKVIIEHENNANSNIHFYINNESIAVESNSDNENVTVMNGKYINVFLNENINFPVICELINMSGKSVNKNIYWSNQVRINTSTLSAGIYILRVRTYDNTMIKTEKLYINNY